MVTRRTFATGAGAAGLLAASAPFSVGRAQGAPLKVGVLLPRSGQQAGIGQDCQRGVDIAAGILKDLGLPELSIMNADTETNVEVARSRAERLIGEGAQLLIGAFDSGQSTAIAQVAEQKGIPYVINIAAAPPITEQGYKFVFRNFPTAPMILGDAFANQKEIFEAAGSAPKSVVFLHVNDTFGTSMQKGIDAVLQKANMPYKIAETIAYDPAARDLSVEVAKAKATKADMLMPVCRLNDAKLMIQELVKQRWEPMAVMNPGSPGLYEQDFLKTMGKYGEFHISNVPWLDPKSAMTQSLVKRHAARFPNDQLDINGGFTFEGMLIAAQAWLDAKSTKPEPLMEALRKIKIDQHVIIGGPIQFDAKGQNVGIKAAAVQNLKRTPTVVMPKESASADLVFPEPGWNDKRRT
jgi:branched-chain amino acid transport system substrate-binding protein